MSVPEKRHSTCNALERLDRRMRPDTQRANESVRQPCNSSSRSIALLCSTDRGGLCEHEGNPLQKHGESVLKRKGGGERRKGAV